MFKTLLRSGWSECKDKIH